MVKVLKEKLIYIIIMSTESVLEKKPKKMTKKVATLKVEENIVPDQTIVNENDVNEASGNDTFFELFDLINEKMTELQNILSNVNVQMIDSKKLIDTRKNNYRYHFYGNAPFFRTENHLR